MQNHLLPLWHSLLRLPRQQPSWYRARLREELQERRLATTPLQRLSETADVFYVLTRAVHDGNPLQSVPSFRLMPHGAIYAYMVAKYTSRWLFYRVAGGRGVREVMNPAKGRKIGEVASRHGLDRVEFERVCARLRRFWPLLP